MTNTEDCETYVDDVSDNKQPKSQEDTTNCITFEHDIFVKNTYQLRT